MKSVLEGLNPQQREAVKHFGSPLLVLAGAGSGKTKVITHKIAYLVSEKGVRPDRILAITFTKKAAREMQERVERLLSMRPPWISTFHSFCARVLRESVRGLEKTYDRSFLIYDEADTQKLLKEILKGYGIDIKEADAARSVISRAKQAYRENIVDAIRRLSFPDSRFAPVAELYQQALERSNAMDFDDLIYNTVDLLSKKPLFRKRWQDRFDYILVDEYQDTNKIQYLLVNLLAGDRGNVCVVGDPQQCIYTWRGAHPLNIIDFSRDFGASERKLEVNYRSTKKILDVANRIIARADRMWEGRVLELSPDRKDEGEVRYRRCSDHADECMHVADMVKMLNRTGYRYGDMAVLMRMTFVSRGFEHTFMAAGIPHEIVGGAAFYERAEVKDMLCYLRLMVNDRDKAAFDRVINTPPRSFGPKTVQKVRDSYDTGWTQALKDTKLSAKQRSAADALIAVIEKTREIVEDKPYSALMEVMKKIRYDDYLEDHYRDDADDRKGNISELANVLKTIEMEGRTFSSFLEDSVLTHDQDRMGDADSVKVMTIHAAKGLEFPVVFVVALEEEIFPSARALRNEFAMEEERRLFYVAVTRAKERLYLSSAAFRMRFGETMMARTSRYIAEIADELRR
ncbi:MAG TPA: UvrD-helicase domain-containing protein [Dissulfurispiraceae bacterium]|nr:UvrD-helicase domain-containing protein [Dissulfurispiraceae bacterium]